MIWIPFCDLDTEPLGKTVLYAVLGLTIRLTAESRIKYLIGVPCTGHHGLRIYEDTVPIFCRSVEGDILRYDIGEVI